jgi:Ca2+-binding EF-hand superfamily protein
MSMDDAVALFQRFDLNGNGTLGFDELRESFASKKMPRVRQSCHMHCLHFFVENRSAVLLHCAGLCTISFQH